VNLPLSKQLSAALIGTGLIDSVWHCADEGDEATALCRAVGTTTDDKEKAMEMLAKLVTPVGVFVAKQFIYRGGKFGFCWNVSIFRGEHLEALKAVKLAPPAPQAPPVPRDEPQDDRWKEGIDMEGEVFYYLDFVLPHASANRNAPTKGMAEGDVLPAPLGHGRGVTKTAGGKGRR